MMCLQRIFMIDLTVKYVDDMCTMCHHCRSSEYWLDQKVKD